MSKDMNDAINEKYFVVTHYVAAPGGGTYHYKEFDLRKAALLVNVNVGNDDPSMYAQVWVYEGARTAYAAANNIYTRYLQRMIQANAGAGMPAYLSYISQPCKVYCPAGHYTGAIRASVAMTHFRMILTFEYIQ